MDNGCFAGGGADGHFSSYITKLASGTCNYFYLQPAQYKAIRLNERLWLLADGFQIKPQCSNEANILMEIPKAPWDSPECWRHFNVMTQSFVEKTSASEELRAPLEIPGEPKEAQWLRDFINTHI